MILDGNKLTRDQLEKYADYLRKAQDFTSDFTLLVEAEVKRHESTMAAFKRIAARHRAEIQAAADALESMAPPMQSTQV